MIGLKVKFYKSRNPNLIGDGVILDKVILKEFDVAVTGYIIDINSELYCVKCWDLIKIV